MKVSKFGFGLVATCFVLSLGLAACKSDKKTTPPAVDAGSDSAVATDAGGGKDGGTVTKEQCIAAQPAELPAECASCACECDPAVTSMCDKDCWALIKCVADKCGGSSEVKCITANCLAEATAGTAATTAKNETKCATQCASKCTPAVTMNDAGMSMEDAGGGNDAGN